MGMSEFYGTGDDDESIAHHPPRPRPRGDLPRHLRHVRPVPQRGAGRPGHRRPAGRGGAGHQVRDRPRGPDPAVRDGPGRRRPTCARPARRSLGRLGVDHIDLYYQHRTDAGTSPSRRRSAPWPSWWPRARSGTSGLSEALPDTMRRAAAVHPIAALQSEWSLWSRDIEDAVIATARRAGHRHRGLQPARPGLPHRPDHLAGRLPRGRLPGRTCPGSPGENFAHNIELVDQVRSLAATKGCTPGQLALAWVLARGDDVVPIPGTKRRTYLEENVGRAGRRADRRRPRRHSRRCSRSGPGPGTATRT